MSSATIELHTADLTRLETSVASGVLGAFEPFFAQQHDSDIMGLRSQIYSNLQILLLIDPVNPKQIHIITLGEAPKIRAFVFAGKIRPALRGEDACSTSGALKNLLKQTQQLLQIQLCGIPTKTNANTSSIGFTPSKVGARASQLTPVKFKPAHTRVNSALNAWSSTECRNPSFGSSIGNPESQESGFDSSLFGGSFSSETDTIPDDDMAAKQDDSLSADYVNVILAPAQIEGRAKAPVMVIDRSLF